MIEIKKNSNNKLNGNTQKIHRKLISGHKNKNDTSIVTNIKTHNIKFIYFYILLNTILISISFDRSNVNNFILMKNITDLI